MTKFILTVSICLLFSLPLLNISSARQIRDAGDGEVVDDSDAVEPQEEDVGVSNSEDPQEEDVGVSNSEDPQEEDVGGSNPEEPIVEDVGDDTGNGETPERNSDDEDWSWLGDFEEYLDEDDRTVIEDEESPIEILGNAEDTVESDEDKGTGIGDEEWAAEYEEEAEEREERSLHREGRKVSKLVPIKVIPGTELYTGLWYKLGMKAFPRGFVVPSNERTGSGYNKLEMDLDPDDLMEHFKKGGSKEITNEWMFAPTETKGWYILIPRAYPKGMATYVTERQGRLLPPIRRPTPKGDPTLRVVVADRNSEIINLLRGGKFRADALWRPVDSGEKDFYKLETKNHPNQFATWTSAKHGNHNHWIQIAKDYGDDSKFTFSPAGIILNSQITSLTFRRSPQEVLKSSSGKQKTELHSIDVSNPSTNASMEYVIANSETKRSQWEFGLKENVEWLTSLSIEGNVGLPFIASAKTTASMSFKIGLEASQQYTTETQQTFTINIKLSVPPKTDIKGTVYYEWLQNMELEFDATMAVKGTAHRLVNDESGKMIPGPVDPKFVEAYLKSNYEDSEFVGAVDGRKGVFNIQVSGTLKGSMGTKTLVAIDGPEPDGLKILGKHTKDRNKAKPTTATAPSPRKKTPSRPTSTRNKTKPKQND